MSYYLDLVSNSYIIYLILGILSKNNYIFIIFLLTLFYNFNLVSLLLYIIGYLIYSPYYTGKVVYMNKNHMVLSSYGVCKIYKSKYPMKLGSYYQIKANKYGYITSRKLVKTGQISYLEKKRINFLEKLEQFPYIRGLLLGDNSDVNQRKLRALCISHFFKYSTIHYMVISSIINYFSKRLSLLFNRSIYKRHISHLIFILLWLYFSQYMIINWLFIRHLIYNIGPNNRKQSLFWISNIIVLIHDPSLLFSYGFYISNCLSLCFYSGYDLNLVVNYYFRRLNLLYYPYQQYLIYCLYLGYIMLLFNYKLEYLEQFIVLLENVNFYIIGF